MLLTSEDRGVYPIAITPFDAQQEIDWASVDRLMDFYLACGVQGVTLLGILGEPQKLSDAEQMALVRHVLRRVAGRLKVVVGASKASAHGLRAFAAEVMDLGAAGLMISPAPTVRHEEQLQAFFAHVQRSLDPRVPIVLQDFPRLTGVTISAGAMDRLVEAVPAIQVIKHEEDGGLRKITRARQAEAAGRRRVA
ncbi:MAG: dihydrodipicolinate synthase family protein, partial [Comamonadaceae bacterium]